MIEQQIRKAVPPVEFKLDEAHFQFNPFATLTRAHLRLMLPTELQEQLQIEKAPIPTIVDGLVDLIQKSIHLPTLYRLASKRKVVESPVWVNGQPVHELSPKSPPSGSIYELQEKIFQTAKLRLDELHTIFLEVGNQLVGQPKESQQAILKQYGFTPELLLDPTNAQLRYELCSAIWKAEETQFQKNDEYRHDAVQKAKDFLTEKNVDILKLWLNRVITVLQKSKKPLPRKYTFTAELNFHTLRHHFTQFLALSLVEYFRERKTAIQNQVADQELIKKLTQTHKISKISKQENLLISALQKYELDMNQPTIAKAISPTAIENVDLALKALDLIQYRTDHDTGLLLKPHLASLWHTLHRGAQNSPEWSKRLADLNSQLMKHMELLPRIGSRREYN